MDSGAGQRARSGAAAGQSDHRGVGVGAAATLATIVLPRSTIVTALKEAAMPVPVRDTPLGRELYEEGERAAVVRLTLLLL